MMLQWSERKTRTLTWAAIFSLLPSLATVFLFLESFSWDRISFAFRQGLISAALVAFLIFLYHLSFRRLTTPVIHPYRHLLIHTWIGTALTISAIALGRSAEEALLGGVIANLAIIFALRKHLFWDALFASLGLGVLFIGVSILVSRIWPSPLDDLWLTVNDARGFLLTVPVRQIVVLGLLGVLWGPLLSYLKEGRGWQNSPNTSPDFHPRHLHVKKALTILVLAAGIVTGGWFSYSFILKPQHASAMLATPESVPLDAEIRIGFSRPVNTEDVRLSISPAVEGSWEFKDTALGNRTFRVIAFKPSQAFTPNQEYIIKAEDVKTVIGAKSETHTVTFRSEANPLVTKVEPSQDSTNVAPCAPLTATFDHELSAYWQPEFTLSPSTELEVQKEGATYSLTATQCLEQGTLYTLNLALNVANGTTKNSPEPISSFQTVTAPGLTSHAPQGSQVLTTTPEIALTFSKPMSKDNPGGNVTIEPAVAGSWSWNSEGTVLRYSLSAPLAHATRYTVTAHKGFTDQAGGVLEDNASASFTTIGAATVTGFSPTAGSKNLKIETSVSVSFNQAVVHESAESKFSINPGVPGTFSWSGNTLTFKLTSPLNYSTTYTAAVAAGVQAVHGTPSEKEYSTNFTTKAAPIPPATPITMGLSEQGRAINGYVFGSGKNVIFIHGGIHAGQERSTVTLLNRLVNEINQNKSLVGSDKMVVIVPNANPDGYATRTDKYNAREVNINLNFDTVGWVPFGKSENAPNAGSGPFSEKESRVVRDIALKYGASTMLAFHSKGSVSNPEYGHGPSQALARLYAKYSGYIYYEIPEWDYPGTATKWFVENKGGPSVTIELTSHTVADWSNHQEALFKVLE